jgi:hypothetical protein
MLYEITIKRLTREQHSIRLKMLVWALAVGIPISAFLVLVSKKTRNVEPSSLESVLFGVGVCLALQLIGLSIICGVALVGHIRMKRFDPMRDSPRYNSEFEKEISAAFAPSPFASAHFIGVLAAFTGVLMSFLGPFEDHLDPVGFIVYFSSGVISVLLWVMYLRISLKRL